MSTGTLLLDAALVAAGAAIGAVVRLLLGWVWVRVLPAGFPWAIWAVNMAGSFVAGVLAGTSDSTVFLLAAIGFCGSLTTMSAFAFDTVTLAQERLPRLAWSNVIGSVIPGIVLAAVGMWWGGAI